MYLSNQKGDKNMFKYVWIVMLILMDLLWFAVSVYIIYFECFYAPKHKIQVYDDAISVPLTWFIAHFVAIFLISFFTWAK